MKLGWLSVMLQKMGAGIERNSRSLVGHVVRRLFLFLSVFDCLSEVSSSLGIQFIKDGRSGIYLCGIA